MYTLRFASSGKNWIEILGAVALGLDGYDSRLPRGSRVEIVVPCPREGSMFAPYLIGSGQVDGAFMTPSWVARLAMDGRWPYSRPIPLRALAVFPHDDQLGIAVREDLRVNSLAEIRERRLPLKIGTAQMGAYHSAGTLLPVLLSTAGLEFERWGGKIIGGRYHDRPEMLAQGEMDGIFDEAIHTPRWRESVEKVPLSFMEMEEEALLKLEQQGWARSVLRKGSYPQIHKDLVTVDFGGWLFVCREDLPDLLGYEIVRAIDKMRPTIDRLPNASTSFPGPIQMKELCQRTMIPLHSGAEAYYREVGAL